MRVLWSLTSFLENNKTITIEKLSWLIKCKVQSIYRVHKNSGLILKGIQLFFFLLIMTWWENSSTLKKKKTRMAYLFPKLSIKLLVFLNPRPKSLICTFLSSWGLSPWRVWESSHCLIAYGAARVENKPQEWRLGRGNQKRKCVETVLFEKKGN